MGEDGLTYSTAGVNIDEAQNALRSVSESIAATHNENVLGGIGGFGGMFSGSFEGLQRPVLVSSIDGVGTKTKVAAMTGDYRSLGKDIVNHCINDILCQGARPLFFMDYFGCAMLDAQEFHDVVSSAADACRESGVALIGGETAEMPGVYHDGEIDIVGAIIGVVDYERRLPRLSVQAGDKLIGIASNGLHTNGYSLARKALFEKGGLSVRDPLVGMDMTIGEALLLPHKCYFNAVFPLLQDVQGIRGIAHITGGGLYDNLPRVLPGNMQAIISRRSWEPLPIFRLIQEVAGIEDAEMFRSFNMGIGMVIVVNSEDSAYVVERINSAGEHAAEIGELQHGSHDVQIV